MVLKPQGSRPTLLASSPLLLLLGAMGLWSCGGSSDLSPSAPEIQRFEVNPPQLEAPAEVTIEWLTSNADAIELSQGDQLLDLGDQEAAEGSIVVELAASTTFTLEARGPGGRVTERRDVTVEPLRGPSIGAFDAPEMIEANAEGVAVARIDWAGVERAESLLLVVGDDAPIELDAEASEGSMEFSLEESTTFTLIAANQADELSRSVTVEVVYLPVIESFIADRVHLGSGEELSLSWVTAGGATHVELWEGELQLLDLAPVEGSEAVAPLFSSTFELHAVNAMGTAEVALLEIEVSQPFFESAAIDSDSLWLGDSATLSWETSGGSSLEIFLASTGERICEVDGLESIASSSCVWQPSTPGLYSISLELSNLSGVDSETFELLVGDGPQITRFVVGPKELTAGDEIELSWSVLGDPAGNVPTIELSDDRGRLYDTSEGSEGLLTAVLDEAGPYEFTLEATTDHPRSTLQRATASVLVHPQPRLEVEVTPPIFDDALHEEVVISWTSQDAETLTLYELVDGAQVEVLEILGSDRDAGSYSLVPRQERSFVLVGANALGWTTRREAEVRLAPTEVISFTAEPSEFSQGQEITLRWETRMADEVHLDLGSKDFLFEETTAPYLDLAAMGVERLPLHNDCGVVDLHGCAEVSFPAGFIFPFGATLNDRAWIYTPGYIGFGVPGAAGKPDSLSLNQSFPTDPQHAGISLAPFWDTLAWDQLRFPTGNVYTALLEEDGERIFVIQWKDLSWGIGPDRSSSFNFQVVLREDGRFDYRYGVQSAGNSNLSPSVLAGGSATVGFQLPDQRDHALLLFNGTGGLNGPQDHRTLSFRPMPSLPPSGELSLRPFRPEQRSSITLTASRGDVSHSASLDLDVARRPILILTAEELEPAALDEEFRIGWQSFNAESLVVLDEHDEIRCIAANQEQVDAGLCTLSESAGGDYSYKVRATGAHGSVTERVVQVRVFGSFGVAEFKASKESVERGDEVLLEWLVFATESVRLLANGVEIHSDESGALRGSFLVEAVTADTEFKLIATNDVGVEAEAVVAVELWPFVFGVRASADSVRPGDTVDITIDARTVDGGEPVSVYGMMPMVEDLDPANRYSDISSHPSAVDLDINQMAIASTKEVELPFPFPFMGELQTTIYTYVAGYISFTPNAAQFVSNQPIPSDLSHSVYVNIAPFWDYLHPRNLGKMHTAQPDADTFVIQWSRMSQAQTTTNAFPQNMNFQLVLHRSGSFEFRYGAMDPHPTNRPNTCHPNTCVNEMAGSSASLGYQLTGGTKGYSLHFGGTNQVATNVPMPGGLANRTFRYQVFEGSHAFQVTPEQTTTFTLCSDTAEGPLCRDLTIEVPFGFESVSISEELLGFNEPTTLSWTSVGGKSLRILEGETVVYETTDLAEVDSHSVVLHPTQNTIYQVELTAGSRTEVIQKVVEVDRFSITTTIDASSGPGTAVSLSWNLQSSGDAELDLHVVAPMVEISNEDYSRFDIATDSEAIQLIGTNSDNNIATLNFEDFSFPYFGVEYSSVRVSTDGYLTWADGNTIANNTALPDATYQNGNVAIAPFWDNLHTWSNGRVLAKKIDEDRYVIQWSRVSMRFGPDASNEADLNFLVVLNRDGSFEYRFGLMRPPLLPAANPTHCAPVSCERETNGSSATIGYQIPGGSAGYLVHFGGMHRGADQPVVAGGLEDRAWRFTPQKTIGPGSAVLHPADSRGYRICAYDSTSGEVSCPPSVGVEVPWGIDLFQANPIAPLAGQPTTLSWSVQGVDSLRVFADEVELASHSGPELPLLGNLAHTPTAASTTYTLEVSSLGRLVTKEVVVQHRSFDLEVKGPSGIFAPGDVVEIAWELKSHVPGDAVMITPMSEVEVGSNGENGYLDVSTLTGAQELELSQPNSGFAAVEIPFPFPYLGGSHSRLRVFADGYISFDESNSFSTGTNKMLPTRGSFFGDNMHLAVFWDDLFMRGGGSVWSYSPDPDTLIVQWKAFSRTEGSSEATKYDLNFQAVLRSDGSFDYRYGRMAAPPPPFSHDGCNPDDCGNEANGSNATIGYQTFDREFGSTFHIGSLDSSAADEETGVSGSVDTFLTFPGGLEGRTFRYTPATTGSSRVVVGRTTEQEVCAILGDFAECKTHLTEVVAEAGDLIFTELMLDPSDGLSSQWIEVRNLTSRTIDLEGFRLTSAAGEHRIATSLPVDPGAFITLAASSLVPFEPDYVYGQDLLLSRHIDRLNLQAGQVVIATAAWGIDWVIPRDQSLSLDPRHHLSGMAEHPEFTSWCQAGPQGSPGSLGESCTDSMYLIDPASDRPFIDIAGTGRRFYEVERDSFMARLPETGFQPKLFGETYSRIWVSSMGLLSFHHLQPTANFAVHPPYDLPRRPNEVEHFRGPLIAAFWEVLSCGNDQCRVYYEVRETQGVKALIVQWENFFINQHREAGLSFQAQIWEDGDVVVAFAPFENPYWHGDSAWGVHEGGGAVIGLENGDGTVFLDAHFRRSLGLDERSIHFRPRQ